MEQGQRTCSARKMNQDCRENVIQVFQSIQDGDIVRGIRSASQRLVFVAPGVSPAVSAALVACLDEGKVDQIMIVLDADEDACRLGYCDALSLQSLSAAATKHRIFIRSHPGLRLGLLLADEDVLIWTPTPLMFEAPRGATETNGIRLTPHTLSALPAALGVALDEPWEDAEIGTSELQLATIAITCAAIKAAPPAPFDVTRIARVFSTKFQFVETVLRGAELTKREIRLDSLIVNSDVPEELQSLLQTTVQPFITDADKLVKVPILFDGEPAYTRAGEAMTRATTQAEIHSYWSDLTAKYVINLPGFGKIIRQTDKPGFEAGKAAFEIVLKAWVDGFRLLVKADHSARVGRMVNLIEQRMTRAPENQRLERPAIERLVREGLDNLRVIEPSVKVVFKNITVESARDKEFVDVLRKAVPEREFKDWFHIFDAAPMVQLEPTP